VSHTQILTPGYAPLEQYTKQAKRGPYTDIYALGAMMYEMLTGEVPPSAPDRVAGVELEDIRNKVNVDKNIAEVIMKCLELNAKDRYQNVDEMIQSLYTSGSLQTVLSKLVKFKKIFNKDSLFQLLLHLRINLQKHPLKRYSFYIGILNIFLMFISCTWFGYSKLSVKKAIFLALASLWMSPWLFRQQSHSIKEEISRIFFVDSIFIISMFVTGLVFSIRNAFLTFLFSAWLMFLHAALNIFQENYFKYIMNLKLHNLLIFFTAIGIAFLLNLGWFVLVFCIILLRSYLNNDDKFGGLMVLEIAILVFSSSKFFYFSQVGISTLILFFVLETVRYFLC